MRARPMLLCMLFAAYAALMVPFSGYMQNKPFVEKMGYVPQADAMRFLSADQKEFVAAWLLLKTITYYGGIAQQRENKLYIAPEFSGMHKTIETAMKLDPYNMDGYYFAQAILTWDMRRVHEANELLDYGMRYRDWDFYLPYFAGFNHAFFLKDYRRAAQYYKRVGELTGDDMIIRLAGRYMYEGGQTDLAISYLSVMEKTARNDTVKRSYRTRLRAFQEVRRIEDARDRYQRATKRTPRSIDELLQKGYLASAPVDPYGGDFYIDENGMVRSTSKFVFVEKVQ